MIEMKCHCGTVIENKYDKDGRFISTNIGMVIHPHEDSEGYYELVRGVRVPVEPVVECNKCCPHDRRYQRVMPRGWTINESV